MTTFEQELTEALPAVLRSAINKVGSSDADDLVQDVAVMAWEKKGLYKAGTNMTGWLMTLMRWVLATRYEKAGYKKRKAILLPLLDGAEIGVPEPGDQDMRFTSDDFLQSHPLEYLSAETYAAISRLRRHHRAVLIACDMQGVPRKDAATKLGYRNTEQLGADLWAARKIMRSILGAL